MKKLKKFLLPTLMLVGSMASNVYAGEDWYVSATASAMPGQYSGSVERDNVFSGSLILNADYLDSFSVALAYNNTRINFKDTGFDAFVINQNAFAGRVQYHFYADSLGGRITTQLVAHTISNNDATKLTDEVSVAAPKIAYMNYAKDLYMDIEYVQSEYPNNANLKMQQFTPSIGFGFNQNSDWLRVKAYLIKSSDKNLSQGEESLTSLDIKWSHWLAPGAALGLNSFFVDVLAGKRIFAVDNDAFTVYNLADVQQGSVLFGLGWKPGEDFDVTVIAGVEKYENKIINNTYNQQYLYVSLTKSW